MMIVKMERECVQKMLFTKALIEKYSDLKVGKALEILGIIGRSEVISHVKLHFPCLRDVPDEDFDITEDASGDLIVEGGR